MQQWPKLHAMNTANAWHSTDEDSAQMTALGEATPHGNQRLGFWGQDLAKAWYGHWQGRVDRRALSLTAT